jgi:hypothetical protein
MYIGVQSDDLQYRNKLALGDTGAGQKEDSESRVPKEEKLDDMDTC